MSELSEEHVGRLRDLLWFVGEDTVSEDDVLASLAPTVAAMLDEARVEARVEAEERYMPYDVGLRHGREEVSREVEKALYDWGHNHYRLVKAIRAALTSRENRGGA